MSFGNKALDFFQDIEISLSLPEGVEVLNPYKDPEVLGFTREFFDKYYSDTNPRVFLIGINPGRLGAGSTGIGFTDPVNLETECGIANGLEKKHELSSRFIYQMINAFSTPSEFYSNFYFTSVCPLGFTMEGRNLNYYDIAALQTTLEPFMVQSLKTQISFGTRPMAFSLGMGKNVAYLRYLNEKYTLFESIVGLPHPRWIMQYKLKRLDEFLDLYHQHLSPFLRG